VLDVCVIGAGVVGLAVARQLAAGGKNVLVVEREDEFGKGISSRNSEVIHAGIHYPQGSLKATLCVSGKSLLYEYCATRNIGCKQIGKLIVATTSAEVAQLEVIKQQAEDNGVKDLREVSNQWLANKEPALKAKKALFSPSTGIICASDFMHSLLADLESCGGILATRSFVRAIEQTPFGLSVKCDIENESYDFKCKNLINSGGLGAKPIAESIIDLSRKYVPPIFLCKGSYFSYQGSSPFSHLVYPVPDPGGLGLGVHATINFGGQLKFGPDVEYVETENYEVSDSRLAEAIKAIKKYFPLVETNKLVADYAGIRPKLQGPSDQFSDFMIQGEEVHQIPGLINLFGIESPGLTASMAIAETVAARLYQE